MIGYGPDARKLFVAQGVRAFAYGFSAVLLGTSLDDRGLSAWQVGVVLGATVAGTALMSVLVARYADRVGRRRWYAGLYVLLGVVGVVFAVRRVDLDPRRGGVDRGVVDRGDRVGPVHLTGAADAGQRHPRPRPAVHGFGIYNAVAAVAGSFGALAGGRARAPRQCRAEPLVRRVRTARRRRLDDRPVAERRRRTRRRRHRSDRSGSVPADGVSVGVVVRARFVRWRVHRVGVRRLLDADALRRLTGDDRRHVLRHRAAADRLVPARPPPG